MPKMGEVQHVEVAVGGAEEDAGIQGSGRQLLSTLWLGVDEADGPALISPGLDGVPLCSSCRRVGANRSGPGGLVCLAA